MNTKNCSQCGNEMTYKSGISQKNNKPYQMYKCGSCSYAEFIKDNQQKPQYQSKPQVDWEKIRNEKRESISQLNALNNAVSTANAWLAAGKIKDNEEYRISVEYFINYYLSLNENGNTHKTTKKVQPEEDSGTEINAENWEL